MSTNPNVAAVIADTVAASAGDPLIGREIVLSDTGERATIIRRANNDDMTVVSYMVASLSGQRWIKAEVLAGVYGLIAARASPAAPAVASAPAAPRSIYAGLDDASMAARAIARSACRAAGIPPDALTETERTFVEARVKAGEKHALTADVVQAVRERLDGKAPAPAPGCPPRSSARPASANGRWRRIRRGCALDLPCPHPAGATTLRNGPPGPSRPAAAFVAAEGRWRSRRRRALPGWRPPLTYLCLTY